MTDELIFHLDHVAVAVHSIEDALPLFRDLLGGREIGGGDMPVWRWYQLEYANGRKLELLEPRAEGFLTKFLEKRGEGLHHITFKTNDIKRAIELVEERGYEVTDVNLENEGWKEAFLRPKKAHGTLIQIAQPGSWDKSFAQETDAQD